MVGDEPELGSEMVVLPESWGRMANGEPIPYDELLLVRAVRDDR